MQDSKKQERLGHVRYNIDVASELTRLANEDEAAADLLQKSGHYRHAIYLYLQAIEKTVRAEIFTIVDPTNRFFRDYNRHHSLKMSFDFFAQIVSPDLVKRAELRERLDDIVSTSAQQESLHNGLRYPWYSERYDNFNIANFDKSDSEHLRTSLDNLKQMIKEIERYR